MSASGASARSLDEEHWDVCRTTDWILSRGFQRIALQFPDELLHAAPSVVAAIKRRLSPSAKVCVLADSTYNPLGVDEVTAQHMAADCVVHYGRASLAPVMQLPALIVLPKEPLDCTAAAHALQEAIRQAVEEQQAQDRARPFSVAVVLLDQAYHHVLPVLHRELEALQGKLVLAFVESAACCLEPASCTQSAIATSATCCRAATSLQQPEPGTTPSESMGTATAAAAATASAAGASAASPATAGAMAGCSSSCACVGADPGTQTGVTLTEPGAAAAPPPPGPSSSSSSATAPSRSGQPGGSEEGSGRQDDPSGATPSAATAEEASASMASQIAQGGDPVVDDMLAGLRLAADKDSEDVEERGTGSVPPDDGTAAGGTQVGGTPAGQAQAASTSGAGGQKVKCAGFRWTLPVGVSEADCLMLWLGPLESLALQVLQLSHSRRAWRTYDPVSGTHQSGVLPVTSRLLKRRYFLVEKARAASIVGILVGTLSTAGFVEVIDRIRRLAQQAGKKTYTMLMGKPNPAKLANFPEVEVFVMVADPQGLLLDSREYLSPIVTPFEAELAFRGMSLSPDYYSLDFNYRLEGFKEDDGGILKEGAASSSGDTAGGQQRQQLQLRDSSRQQQHLWAAQHGSSLAARDAADYLLHKRMHWGVETPLTGAAPAPVKLAVAGRSGRAAGYEGEVAGVGAEVPVDTAGA